MTYDPTMHDLGELLDAIEELQQGQLLVLTELQQLRQLVERRSPARQADDVLRELRAVLLAVREAIGERAFMAAELVEHARTDPQLHAALQAADLVTPHDVGMFCHRMQGVVVNGLWVEREAGSRQGVWWRVRL